MIADIMAKGLSPTTHQKHTTAMGMVLSLDKSLGDRLFSKQSENFGTPPDPAMVEHEELNIT